MAKRKKAADTHASTAKVEKDPEYSEKEVKIKRKIKPKPRTSESDTGLVTKTTSKYFLDMSPMKKKEESDDEDDDGIMDVTRDSVAVSKPGRQEEEVEEEEGEDDSEEEDWEEVEELSEPLGVAAPEEPGLAPPPQPVEIEIETPDLIRKRQKREKRKAEFDTYMRRMVNRFNKDVAEDTHKVHLLCLLANGMFRNRLCSEPDLLAVTLSLLPTHFTMVTPARRDENFLSGLLKWFGATFTLTPELPCEERPNLRLLLERRLASLTARDHQEMNHLFLLVLRSLQLFCRLVISLQPLSLKPPATKGKVKTPSPPSGAAPRPGTAPCPGTKRPAEGRRKGGKKPKKKQGVEEEKEEEEEEEGERRVGQKPKNSKRRSVASKVSYKEDSSEGEGPSEGEEFQMTNEEESEDSEGGTKATRGKKGKGKTGGRRRSGAGKMKVKSEEEDESFEVEEERGMEGTGRASGAKRGRRKEGAGADEWLEVYVEKSGRWVCVDVSAGVGRPQDCVQNATAPLTYVAALDGHGRLKDLSRKYDPTWMTRSRQRRVDEAWWEETLEPFLGSETAQDLEEDKELQARLLNRPLPTTVAEYKNHPMYALKRHLLKYEAVYPLTAAILGYCRGEAVYSRDCVHTLHSRDTWLKEARTVRLGEEPFKMVKGSSNRSKKARVASEQKDAADLPLFGPWQTEPYQPPLAVDGRVPRNDYGNVYLFQPCMLPVGCVHLRLPQLHRVARKLQLDAAPAVTGFDFHGGFSHAVTDGYVVCEEHEEILRAAWVEDQEIQRQKEREKREKRAVGNWTLLVKGLLIKERLRRRYGPQGSLATTTRQGGDGLSSDEEGEAGDAESPTAAVSLAQSWPQNRQEEQDGAGGSSAKTATKRGKRDQQKHLFPFEKV